MLHDYQDLQVESAKSLIMTGQKWNAEEDEESYLKMKEVVGAVATGRADVSFHPQCWNHQEIEKYGDKRNILHQGEQALQLLVNQNKVHELGG